MCGVLYVYGSFTEMVRQEQNKLDTGEDRTSQRMRMRQRLEYIVKISMMSSRAIQAEVERSQIESVSLKN